MRWTPSEGCQNSVCLAVRRESNICWGLLFAIFCGTCQRKMRKFDVFAVFGYRYAAYTGLPSDRTAHIMNLVYNSNIHTTLYDLISLFAEDRDPRNHTKWCRVEKFYHVPATILISTRRSPSRRRRRISGSRRINYTRWVVRTSNYRFCDTKCILTYNQLKLIWKAGRSSNTFWGYNKTN